MKRQHSRRGGWNFPGAGGRLRPAPMRRRPAVDFGRGLGPEALEVRTLLSGQAVQLIQDVNTTESHPTQLTPVGSNLFFVVEDATRQGTELVADNATGTTVLLDTGASSSSYSIYSLTAVGGTLYFQYSSSSGSPLWTSDGTVAGTRQVTLTGASGSPYPQGTIAVGNDLVFWTDNYGSSGQDYQLWSTTPGNTSATMIRDLGATRPTSLGVVNNTLYLSEGGNLWSTDGTAAHTQELLDSSSKPIPAPRTVFGYDGQVEYLAVGTTSSTIGVLGAGGETAAITGLPVNLSNPIVSGSLFYFAASASGASAGRETQLWASDGTQAHTAMIEDFGSISATSGPTTFMDANGTLAFEVEGSDGLAQLWNSGGTAASTKLIKDLGVSGTSAYSGSRYGYGYGYGYGGYSKLVPVNGLLYFQANDPVNGAGLWAETLSTGGTQFVSALNPQSLVAWGNQLAFAANDGSEPVTSQLWTTTGTAAPTKAASFPGGSTNSSVNQPGTSIAIGTKLLIPLDDGIHGTGLWATDGTAGGTQRLAQVAPTGFASLNGVAYFLGMAGGSPGLWKSDGTAGGTAEVMALTARSSPGYSLGQITVVGGKLYFTTGDGSKGEEVWASDGTTQGTSVVQDFPAPPATAHYSQYANLSDLTAFGGKVAFIADSGSSGTQVWISDGTAGGTVKLTDIAQGARGYSSQSPSHLTVAGGKLFFLAGNATDATAAPGLWTSDGTPGGTSELFAFPTLPASTPNGTATTPTLENLTAVGSVLYLEASYSYYNGTSSVNEAQLWTSNGTAAGTVRVPASDGGTFTRLSGFVSLGGRLLFQAGSSSGASELWASNGTAAGTSEIKIIDPSSAYSYGYRGYGYSSGTLVDNGIVYFSANDGTHGSELWQSDGTTAGTFMTADINPGASSSSPTPLAILGGQLVLSADDGTHGSELMTLAANAPESAPTFATIPGQDVTVGESISLDMALYASDPNAPPLPLTYALGADAPSFASIDPSTGVLSLAPPPGTTAQSYTLTITATDDGASPLSATATVTVGVHDVASPTIDTIYSQSITQGYTFQLDVAHYTHDDNYPAFPLTYSLTSAPSGATIDPNTGIITWATAANQAATSYSFTVEAADNSSPPLTASQTFTVSVQKLQPPSFQAVPTKSVDIGSTLSLDLSTYTFDPNSPMLPLTYQVTSTPPAGLSLDATTGQLTWTPGAGQATGPVSITVQVSDNNTPPLTASQTFTIDVLAQGALAPPVLQSLPTLTVTAGETLTSNLSTYASDPNSPALPLTFSLGTDAPSGASITSSGTLTWATNASQPLQPVTFTVIVSDNQSPPNTTSGTITFNVAAPQSPYIVSNIPIQGVSIGNTLTAHLSSYAFDSNSPALPLTYTLGAGAPSGASLDATTGVFTWAPGASVATGIYTVPFSVADNATPARTASGTFRVLVGAAGQPLPPVFSSTPFASATVGATLTADLSTYAQDLNTPALPLTFSLGNDAPAGASISSSGTLTWAVPANEATGQVTFTVIVSDNQSPPATASAQITVYVNSVQAPFINGNIPDQSVTTGNTLTFDLSHYASDPNNPPLPLTYTLGANAPSGASLNATTGVFTWTPDASVNAGTYTIPFTVADNGSPPLTADGSFNVKVGASGTVFAPDLGQLPTGLATIGLTLTTNLSSYASDPNTPALPLTFSLGNDAPAGASISPSGTLTWAVPANEATGQVTFTVIVSDNQSPPATAHQSITFNVQAIQAPSIVGNIPTVDATTGQAVSVNLGQYAYDPNNPSLPLTYALGAGAPADASVGATTGVFTWTPSAADGTGTITIPFTVSDNQSPPNTSSGTLTFSVAGPTIQSPAFGTIPAQDLTAGETLSLNTSRYASDPNNPPLPLTYSLGADAPQGASINASTGVITWATTSSTTVQQYTFTVIATDNSTPANSGHGTVTVNVLAVQPPAIATITGPTAAAGTSASLDLSKSVTDKNAPALPLTFSLVSSPTGAAITSAGAFTWSIPANQAAGPVTITFDVSDSLTSSNPTQGSFTVAVTAAVQSPVIATIPAQHVTAGGTSQLNLSQYASDPNTPALRLTYSLGAGAPSGASLNSSSGAFNWAVPANQAAGPVTVNFTATNGQSTAAAGSFTIDVGAAILSPTVQSIPSQSVNPGQAFQLDLSRYATDPNSPALGLTYALGTSPPAGSSLGSSSGLFTWTVPANQSAGSTTVNFTVTNGQSTATAGSFTINVAPAGSTLPPRVIQPIPVQNATIGQAFTLNLSSFASDPNTPPLRLSYSLGAGAPAGAQIDPNTGVLTWTPPAGQPVGPTTFTLVVADSQSPPMTASASFTVDVAAAQVVPPTILPPVIKAVATAVTATVGQAFSFDVAALASDPNTPPLKLSFSLAGAPTGVSISPAGLLTWNVPASQQVGTYPVTVVVSGSSSPAKTASETIDLQVVDNNPATVAGTASIKKNTLTIVLTFSQPVNQAAASSAASYTLTMPGKKAKAKRHKPAPTPVPIPLGMSVHFNPATNQVTLTTKKPKAGTVLTLTVLGSAITKLDGLQLAGGGGPGTNYVATIRGKSLTHAAAATGGSIVISTHARVLHASAAPALKVAPSASAPGGPLAVTQTPAARSLVLGVLPTGTTARHTK